MDGREGQLRFTARRNTLKIQRPIEMGKEELKKELSALLSAKKRLAYVKGYVEENAYDEALDRIRHLYDIMDKNFSFPFLEETGRYQDSKLRVQ